MENLNNTQTSNVFDDCVKLKEISVYNWGSFNGIHTIHINPEGTLITGENGAGKSTMVDALMTLLRPIGKVTYNVAAAQEQKKDRSLVSYMRGSFGTKLNEEGTQVSRNLRDNSTASIIKATFQYQNSKRQVSLLGVFYILGTSNAYSDVKKIYAVSSDNLVIEEILKAFRNLETRELKAYLNKQNNCHVCDDNFNQYSEYYKHLLHIDNPNAPALLSRALGLKRIDDLTLLIRTLVLEPSDLKEDAKKTIEQFDALKEVHRRLEDAKKQETALEKLPEHKDNYTKAVDNSALYEQTQKFTDIFADKYELTHVKQDLVGKERKLSASQVKLESLNLKIEETNNQKDKCTTDIAKNGGDRLLTLDKDIKDQEYKFAQTSKNLNQYNLVASRLGLKKSPSAEEFASNLQLLSTKKMEFARLCDETDAQRLDLNTQAHLLDNKIKDMQSELIELKKHGNSNISVKFQQLRDTLSEELNIKSSSLIYVAELIEVKKSEQIWQGAIERALGGKRQTLLVSQKDYGVINKWVNSHFLGLHLRVQVVQDLKKDHVDFGNSGFLSKLNFKSHSYTPFLKEYLEHDDLRCVDTVDELNRIEFSMTKEGLIHKRDGFFEKKDLSKIDDRRQWCLGFSNKDKIELLEHDLSALVSDKSSMQSKLTELNKIYKDCNDKIRVCDNLLNQTDYSLIDARSVEDLLNSLKAQYEALKNDNTLNSLIKLLEELKLKLVTLADDKSSLEKQIGAFESEINNLQERIAKLEMSSNTEVPAAPTNLLFETMKSIKADVNNVFTAKNRNLINSYLTQKKETFDKNAQYIARVATAIINQFYTNWESICVDFGHDFESLDSYIEYLNKLRAEGLPKLEEEFKKRLNDEATKSIACMAQKIEQEVSSIKYKIDRVNVVLKKTEFSDNAYLSIECKKLTNVSLQKFEKDTRKVLNLMTQDTQEMADVRYAAIEAVIDTLSIALESNAQEMKTILDPRLRMQFIANVIDKSTGDIKDTLNSSSGKSGGEKESFAGTVLAASLAYVLTPEGADIPIYSTVFLDEAFSNTSDKVSKRVLKVFKELNLHVNLITPFKNIELARDYAKSLVIMDRDSEKHNSSMCELSWEEYDAQLLAKQQNEALELGISVE